jgi:hypothetical protein
MTNYKVCGFALLLLVGAASCDTRVTNPGPVADEFLNERAAATAMVAGAGRSLSQAINWIGYTGAAVTREIHPAGSTGSFGITNRWQNGELNADDADLDVHWEQASRARWVAEEALRRLEAAGPPVLGSPGLTLVAYNNLLQLAYLYAGFANRLMGENFCDCVIDGGALQTGPTVFFQRAESLFTKAIAVTGGTAATITAQRNAAYGGRAAARVHLGDWTNAIADAAQVPLGFTFNMPYYNNGDDAQRNRIFWSSGNSRESGSAYRAHTQWSTWYRDYQLATSDPRVPISTTALVGDAAIACCGSVPFYPEAKHASSAAPVRLTSRREMLLIRAEERMRANDDVGGMALLNQARIEGGAAAITATDPTDAWRLLKRERGIELWLEARRLGDFRRWAAAATPGALDPLESVGPLSHLTSQSLCFPVSRGERDTNPNIP